MPAAISCVTIPVDDLQKSIAFYRDGLGLPAEETDEDHAVFDLDGVYLTLLDRSGFNAYVEPIGLRSARTSTVADLSSRPISRRR